MAECCIEGCSNKATKRGELKFYTLPTVKSSRPNKVKRRRLWLEAIEKANGSIEGLKDDAQICSAHFVSGQMSLEVSDQDFVPSVFPPPRKITRRETLRPRSGALTEVPTVTPKTKAQRKRGKTSEEESQFNNIVASYCEPIEDEELLEDEKKEEEHALLSSDQFTTESPIEVPQEYPQLKKPKLELKSVVVRLGLFQCEVCNGKFSSSSMLVKHKKLHDPEEWSDDESWSTVSKKVSEKSDLNDTLSLVEEHSFKCNMCDRSFPTIHNLKRHKLLHVRDARKCIQCGTMFCKRHNHVIAQPQISTEVNLEDYTTKDEEIDLHIENLSPDTSSFDSDNVDTGLDLLLHSDSQTLDTIAAAQDQSIEDTSPKPTPAITFSPRKPGLLTAFKSFLTKHRIPSIKADELDFSNSGTSSDNKNVTPATTTAITPDTTDTPDTVIAPMTPATTITTSSQSVQEPSSNQVPLITSVNSLAPQAGKPVLFMTQSPLSQIGQTKQNIEKSTVCLSFTKPLPPNVIKEFMTYISKNECTKSTGPRLITFTSEPNEAALKQVLSSIKLEPSTVPIQVNSTQLPNKSTTLQNEEKKMLIMTTQPRAFQKRPSPVKAPSLVLPSIVSPVKPHPKSMKTKKAKPSPTDLVAPLKHYVHESCPPSPVPLMAKLQSGPRNSPLLNYPYNFIQPHLPQKPALPPSLQMFSPQLLTSSFLEVKRDYDYILSK